MSEVVRVETEFPVALDSPDHIMPWGTKNDNTTNRYFIDDMERHFADRKFRMLDIGCSGGQLVADFLARGHTAVGLEGSDYSLKLKRANWPSLGGTNLFTCDCAKPYQVFIDDRPGLFELITAWEFIEHIRREDLKTMFEQVVKHLVEDGLFIGSISCFEDVVGGYRLHQTVELPSVWMEEVLPTHFDLLWPPPTHNWVRLANVYFAGMKKCPTDSQ